MDKKTIRKQLRGIRESLTQDQLIQDSKKIYEAIFHSSFVLPQYIGIYVSYKNEVDTFPIIQQLLNMGKSVCVPKIIGERTMHFYQITSIEDLKPGFQSILEPDGSGEICDQKIELMFTPLVGFNEKLERIGWGGGYYDTYFDTYHPVKIGLAFEFQKVDFKSGTFDIPLDGIITEKSIYYLSKQEKEL